MITTPITDLCDEVMILMPGATLAAVTLITKATLREFFVQSGAWVKELPPVSIKANVDTYYLDPQADGDVLYITAMAYPAGDRYKFLKSLTQSASRARVTAPSAIPIAYHGYVDHPGKFTLYPVVTEDNKQALIPYAALTLHSKDCDNVEAAVPTWMLRYWKDHWIDGISSKMMMQPDKPYTNLLQAKYHATRFRNGISQARDMARRQFTNAETDFQFPGWA
jgi:hypothetical protein